VGVTGPYSRRTRMAWAVTAAVLAGLATLLVFVYAWLPVFQ
jgi:hypothetical protein